MSHSGLIYLRSPVIVVSGPGSVSETEIATEAEIVTNGAPAERGIGNTEGGKGRLHQPRVITLPQRSLR